MGWVVTEISIKYLKNKYLKNLKYLKLVFYHFKGRCSLTKKPQVMFKMLTHYFIARLLHRE